MKPLQYAIAVHESGTEKVHNYVGMEPSGHKFNVLSLDEEGMHNRSSPPCFTTKTFITLSVYDNAVHVHGLNVSINSFIFFQLSLRTLI